VIGISERCNEWPRIQSMWGWRHLAEKDRTRALSLLSMRQEFPCCEWALLPVRCAYSCIPLNTLLWIWSTCEWWMCQTLNTFAKRGKMERNKRKDWTFYWNSFCIHHFGSLQNLFFSASITFFFFFFFFFVFFLNDWLEEFQKSLWYIKMYKIIYRR
jgi:hypothetical protein